MIYGRDVLPAIQQMSPRRCERRPGCHWRNAPGSGGGTWCHTHGGGKCSHPNPSNQRSLVEARYRFATATASSKAISSASLVSWPA